MNKKATKRNPLTKENLISVQKLHLSEKLIIFLLVWDSLIYRQMITK